MGDEKRSVISQKGPQSELPPPPYIEATCSTRETITDVPDGKWDLACTIPSHDMCLCLTEEGRPTWLNMSDHTEPSGKSFRRHGFDVDLTRPSITLKKQSYTWSCERDSAAGGLLLSQGKDLSLANFGNQLVIFERTVEIEDRSRPPPKSPEDKKGSLKVETASPNIFCLTGTDVYQVEGDEKDLVIRSQCFLRLWDIVKGRFRWEMFKPVGQLFCLTNQYVVFQVSRYKLHQRKNGYIHGEFAFPAYSVFISLKNEDKFGPMVTKDGLVLYKPCKKALFMCHIGDREVRIQAWESEDEIRGSLVLRGDLNNLQVEIIGQNASWTKHEMEEPVFKNWDPIKKYVLKT
ncbi:hypothetical protein, variant [Cladophialophora immunda]|uniref:Uncharacterized protein n=1 Tax=Cladophialophora immunda TaxID=569365 RepID=A0A0D2CEV5_9EURO|nr:hypothetical protein, variant [Cladophialophora immunda]KIW22064.1 hypothetical protein, variant [Cladophialophora immunda]